MVVKKNMKEKFRERFIFQMPMKMMQMKEFIVEHIGPVVRMSVSGYRG